MGGSPAVSSLARVRRHPCTLMLCACFIFVASLHYASSNRWFTRGFVACPRSSPFGHPGIEAFSFPTTFFAGPPFSPNTGTSSLTHYRLQLIGPICNGVPAIGRLLVFIDLMSTKPPRIQYLSRTMALSATIFNYPKFSRPGTPLATLEHFRRRRALLTSRLSDRTRKTLSAKLHKHLQIPT